MTLPVICVYGPEAGEDALKRVRATIDPGIPVIAARGPYTLPLGSLVNRLAPRLGDRDLVLLAAGVMLPPLWLQRLTRVIAQDPGVGAVNPVFATQLKLEPEIASNEQCEDADRRLFHVSQRSYFEVSRTNPACVMLRNAVVRQTRQGESIDHAIARSDLAAVCCDHILMAGDGLQIALNLPPDPQLEGYSQTLNEMAQMALYGGPPVEGKNQVLLHLLHGWGGGAERWVNDFAAGDDSATHLILRAQADSDNALAAVGYSLHIANTGLPPVRQWPLPMPIMDTSSGSLAVRAILDEVLADFQVDGIVVSSLIGHDLVALESELPTLIVLHDYYPLCPALNIFFEQICTHCEQPRLQQCLSDNPHNQIFKQRDPSRWMSLRDQYFERLKRLGHTLVAPTQHVQDSWRTIDSRFPARNCTVINHGVNAWSEKLTRPPAALPGTRLKIVVVGRIQGGKGLSLLKAAVEQLTQYADLYLLGCGKQGEQFFGHSRVNIILNYEHARLPEYLNNIVPHVGLLLSTVPETFSYTLSELQALALPVIATRLGSFAERIEHDHDGWLVSPNANALIKKVRELSLEPEAIDRVRDALGKHKPTPLSQMISAYRELLPQPQRESMAYRPEVYDPNGLALARLTRQIEQLGDSLQQSAELAEERQHELHRRAQWVTDLEEQLGERNQWVESLESQLGKTREDFDSLQSDFDERTRWANQLQQEVADTKRDLDQNMRQAEQDRSKARELQTELETEVGTLSSQLHEIRTSTSWRITKPLRLVGNGIKKLIPKTPLVQKLGKVRRSLRMRGWRDTLHIVRREIGRKPATPETPQAMAMNEPVIPFDFAPSQTPEVSIIIPVYNQIQYTYACLKSILTHADELEFEVIVVDDCSSDESEDLLPQFGGLTYHRNAENLGFIGACNAGAGLARGEYLVFLNNDTTVSDGWLQALRDSFDDFPDCGLVGGRLVYPDGRLQESGGIVFADGSGWNYGRFEDPGDPRFSYAREVDYCSGACVMIPRVLFESLGGFDDFYAPAYYEDTDLAFQVREQGLRVMVQPSCSIIHYEGITSGTDTSSGIKQYQVVNQEKFQERWKKALDKQPTPGSEIEWAKEHRVTRKALVIDACVPTPDQDSGSVRMTNLLRLLSSLGYKVTFVAENLRYEGPYTEALQSLGIEVLYTPFTDSIEGWLEQHGAQLDLVLVSRHYVAAPLLPSIREHCPRAKVLFDTVDLHFLREQRQAELEDSESLQAQAEQTRQQELAVARQVDRTLVVSPVEVNELADCSPDLAVSVLSNIHHVYGCRQSFEQRQDLFFVGGFQHPPNVDAVLWFVNEVFPLIRAQLPELQFHVVGSRAPGSIKKLKADGVQVHGFVDDLTPFLDGCRIAVAPLRYGAGVKGKVNMSMSYGQPVVATPIAVEGMHSEDGVDVLVAESGESFAQAVVRLYNNEELWTRLSAAGLENVRRHFSLEAARANLAEILKQVGL